MCITAFKSEKGCPISWFFSYFFSYKTAFVFVSSVTKTTFLSPVFFQILLSFSVPGIISNFNQIPKPLSIRPIPSLYKLFSLFEEIEILDYDEYHWYNKYKYEYFQWLVTPHFLTNKTWLFFTLVREIATVVPNLFNFLRVLPKLLICSKDDPKPFKLVRVKYILTVYIQKSRSWLKIKCLTFIWPILKRRNDKFILVHTK